MCRWTIRLLCRYATPSNNCLVMIFNWFKERDFRWSWRLPRSTNSMTIVIPWLSVIRSMNFAICCCKSVSSCIQSAIQGALTCEILRSIATSRRPSWSTLVLQYSLAAYTSPLASETFRTIPCSPITSMKLYAPRNPARREGGIVLADDDSTSWPSPGITSLHYWTNRFQQEFEK